MSVYVDKITDYKGSVRGYVGRVSQKWCHMTADSLDELHAMADQIGLRRAWFQKARLLRFCHYDLTPSRRAAAVRIGAVEITRADLAARIDRENALPGGPPVAFSEMGAFE